MKPLGQQACLWALVVFAAATCSRKVTYEQALAADWDHLDCQPVTAMGDGETGGTLVVFLHGYSGTGASYRPLALSLLDPHTRVCLPEGPLPHARTDGHIWWEFLEVDRPAFFADDPSWDRNSRPSQQLARASQGVSRLIERLRQRYRPDRTVVAGHSQGGMLALDVAVSGAANVDAVAVIAGALLNDSAIKLSRSGSRRPAVLIVHGRTDSTVSFAEAEIMNRVLGREGFRVRFAPHPGGHGLPPGVGFTLKDFIAGGSSRPVLNP